MPARRQPTVLMTADTVGGVWTYAVDLARGLARRGIDVHVATMGAPLRQDQRRQLAGCQGVTIHPGDWRLEWMDDPWDDVVLAGAWLLGLERQIEPDLLHLNQFAFGSLPFLAPRMVLAHSCVFSWWQAVHGERPPASWGLYRARVAAGLAGAALVAAPTRAMLDTLAPNYGITLPRPRVLPNGRSAGLFHPGAKRDVVLAAGRFWDEAKNLAALDAVAPGLAWPIRLAGSCSHPDGRTLQPAGVVPLGELAAPELAREMAAASIFAHPARYEPFGLSVLEAALSGCALVLGDIPSLRETWGDAAVYVPPDDHAALRATLQRLIHDDSARGRLAIAALERAQGFGIEAAVDACLRAYGELSPAFVPEPEEALQCA